MARARAQAASTKAKTTKAKAPAKPKVSNERVVHAESEAVEIVSHDGRWWVASKRRPELGEEEVTVEYAAWFLNRKPGAFTHHRGLPGGEAFDALV